MSKAHRVSADVQVELDDRPYDSLCEVHRRLKESLSAFAAIKAIRSLDLTGVCWRTPDGRPYFLNAEQPQIWFGSSGWMGFDRKRWERSKKDWLLILNSYRLKRANEVEFAFSKIVDRLVATNALNKELGRKSKPGPPPGDFSELEKYVEFVRSDMANGIKLADSLKVRAKEFGFRRDQWRKDTARLRGYRSRQSKRMS